MVSKQAIISELGNDAILTPERIARALIANDQVKYYFALLQTARANADHPRVPALDLKAERMASNLADIWLDDVVAGTRRDDRGAYRIPNGAEIMRRIRAGLEAMVECLPEAVQAELRARMEVLPKPALASGAITGAEIAAMTSGDHRSGDSLHILVMDAHRAINRLQVETAVETVSGARAHHLSPLGRRRVEAFMRGLNRTAPLKFDHPGLDTTATELDGQLLIQNDIGTTDAHVLVLRVKDLSASVTYTDIHKARLAFFQSLFGSADVVWTSTERRQSDNLAEGDYMLTTGHFAGRSDGDIEQFLALLGSRIVFLIDWNKMRKRLQSFVGKSAAISVLKWAADNDYGHRALLEIGGENALGEAVEYAAGARLRYGQRLDQLISDEAAVLFLQDAMRLASTGLRQRRSRRNINDEIKARLARSFETQRLGIFDLAADHAAVAFDVASLLAERLARMQGAGGSGALSRLAARAAAWEARADQILNDARDDIRRFERPQSLRAFFEEADDAVDNLEEAVSILELVLLVAPTEETVTRMRDIADLALLSAQDIVRCVACSASVTRSDVRDDLDEFIAAMERLVAFEHQADDALRTFRRWMIETNMDPRLALVVRDFVQSVESATDAQAHAAQHLRSYLMEEVIAQ